MNLKKEVASSNSSSTNAGTIVTTTTIKRTVNADGTVSEEKIVETKKAGTSFTTTSRPNGAVSGGSADFQHASPQKTKITDLDTFQRECLNAHNAYRKKHRVAPLELDKGLCRYAQNWANKLVETGQMQHNPDGEYGENIYFAYNVALDGEVPVTAWYSEIKDYKFGTNQFTKNTGHFTQVVWKNSQKMGVGVAQKGAESYVVANYDPPGNYVGQYTDNVLRPN